MSLVGVMRFMAGCAPCILLICSLSLAQHGSAPNGYYPSAFNGDTWTGRVTKVSDESREILLSYVDKKHLETETFIGVLAKGYTVRLKDGRVMPLQPSDLRLGGTFTVYYYKDTTKVDGKKIHINNIFMIKGLPDVSTHFLNFKAF